MKKNQIFKFSMTVICSMILAACGSSGGDSPSTSANNTAQQQAAAEAAAKAAAEKAAAEAAAKAAEEAKKAAEAAALSGASVDETPLKNQPVATGDSYVGYKQIVKKDSDLKLTSDKNLGYAIGMNVQNPNRRLDTLVVANFEKDGKTITAYLEDLDFSTARSSSPVKAVNGSDGTGVRYTDATSNAYGAAGAVNTVKKIYIDSANTKIGAETAPRSVTEARTLERTRTITRGVDTGTFLVYNTYNTGTSVIQTLQPNSTYTNPDVDPGTGLRKTYKNSKGVNEFYLDRSEVRDLLPNRVDARAANAGSVGEIYGFRTNPTESIANAEFGIAEDTAAANLPLEDKRLTKVQYGRITTALNNIELENFKDGVLADTKVVSFGHYGDAGTENQYFYRGIDNTTAAQLAKVKAESKSGTLSYAGHAVSYGLDNMYNHRTAGKPTAIGSPDKRLSGNHVSATVNLKTSDVTGSIYNKWYDFGADAEYNVDLVTFKGKLAENGNIAGDSKNTKTGTEGLFGATLFGSKAGEMGGTVQSNDRTTGIKADGTGSWGAVFGAISSGGYVEEETNSSVPTRSGN